jgi:hypothetical protein
MYAHTHTNIHTHMHAYIHTCTQTHTYTQTHITVLIISSHTQSIWTPPRLRWPPRLRLFHNRSSCFTRTEHRCLQYVLLNRLKTPHACGYPSSATDGTLCEAEADKDLLHTPAQRTLQSVRNTHYNPKPCAIKPSPPNTGDMIPRLEGSCGTRVLHQVLKTGAVPLGSRPTSAGISRLHCGGDAIMFRRAKCLRGRRERRSERGRGRGRGA